MRDKGLWCSFKLLPILIILIPDSCQIERQARLPIAGTLDIGHSREIRHPSFISCRTFHLHDRLHRKYSAFLNQLAAGLHDEVIHRQLIIDLSPQILRQPVINHHFPLTRLRWKKHRGLPAHRRHHGIWGFSVFSRQRVDQISQHRLAFDFFRNPRLHENPIGTHLDAIRHFHDRNPIICQSQFSRIKGFIFI